MRILVYIEIGILTKNKDKEKKKEMAQRNNTTGGDNTGNIGNQPTSTSAFVQLIASLFELSKAANEASKAAVDFFNVVDAKPQYSAPPVFDPSLLAPQPQQQMTQQMQQQMQQLQQQMQQRQQDAFGGSPGTAGAVGAAAPVETQRKKKKKRDPNAPKKPLTSFFLYSNFMRDVIIKERMQGGEEPLSQPRIAQETSKRWKALSADEKLGWKELYEEQKKRYEAEMKKYNLAKATGQPYTAPKRKNVILAPSSYSKKRTGDYEGAKKHKKKRHD